MCTPLWRTHFQIRYLTFSFLIVLCDNVVPHSAFMEQVFPLKVYSYSAHQGICSSCGTRNSITVFSNTSQCTLSWDSLIHSMLSHPAFNIHVNTVQSRTPISSKWPPSFKFYNGSAACISLISTIIYCLHLTTWSTVLLEKLVVSQLSKKTPACYGTRCSLPC
jgi:hypothetical protein